MATTEQVKHIIDGWSLQEKIGQLFILAFPGKDASKALPMIADYNLGGCYLSQDNADTFMEAQQLNQELDRYLLQYQRLPLLLGVDQEGAWGVLVGESTTGPGNLALGVSDHTGATRQMYQYFANEMRYAGFNCILGPCCDVNANPLSPIIDTRSFGDITEKVAKHSAAAVKGLADDGIVSCAKHFPGHGDTQGDSHREIPCVDKSLAQLQQQDLAPFQAAIDAGVDLIMTSHIRYPQIDAEHPATLSAPILQQVLRHNMGFDGIIISDSMNMGAIVHHYQPVDAAIKAMQAGITMIMLSEEHYDHSQHYLDKQLAMIHGLIEAVEDGRLDLSVIEQALQRIVAFKLDKLVPMQRYQGFDMYSHQRFAEQCAAQAVVWQRQQHPLDLKQPIYVVNATEPSAYHNLINPRGIGPNQAISAYQIFVQTLAQLHPVVELSHAQLQQQHCSSNLVIVTENYPLPGEDFNQQQAQQLVQQLSQDITSLTVVALRSPYDLLKYPNVNNYLCSHSSRPESAQAAALVLLQKIPAAIGTAVAQVH